MDLMRCVGHAINVPSASPTTLTSDVGTGTSILSSLTSSTIILVNSSWMGTLCIVEALGYTIPMDTRRGGTSLCIVIIHI